HLQRLAPGCLLLIVDLPQIKHGTLHRPAIRYTPVLDDAEVAVVLAVLLAAGAAQKHRSSRMPWIQCNEKRVGLHSACLHKRTVDTHPLQPRRNGESAWNCESQVNWRKARARGPRHWPSCARLAGLEACPTFGGGGRRSGPGRIPARPKVSAQP